MRRLLDAVGIRYALVGGHALAARGYPRFTIDIDLLTTDVAVLDAALWRPLEDAGAEVECRRGDSSDPLAGVVHVLLDDDSDVDIVVARERWQADVVARAEMLTVAPGVDLPVPDAADLILLKLAAGGVLDLRDAAALLATDRERLVPAVESRLAAAAVGLDATACWRQVLALPA